MELAESADWRLTGDQGYLNGLVLHWQPYQRYSDTWEHDHCELCFAKFTEDLPDTHHEGYTTRDRYRWICQRCFSDHHSTFGWCIAPNPREAG